jgi:hypothetical protein
VKRAKPVNFVDVVMSGFPDVQAPIFIEVENENRESVKFGEWLTREDGQLCCVSR